MYNVLVIRDGEWVLDLGNVTMNVAQARRLELEASQFKVQIVPVQ